MSSLTANTIVNRRVNPLLSGLPEWVEQYRPEQVRAVTAVMRGFEDSDVVVLDAPTGSGKTLIAETVRLLRREAGVYVCSSLGLQDQFARDFPYSKVVKGRRNYPTGLYPTRYPYLSCDDCQWVREKPECNWCADKRRCPYEVAKVEGIKARLAVLNSSYALTEWNGPGRFSGRELAIVDEADTLENAVMGYVSVSVGRRRMTQYGWNAPTKVTVVECWQEWLAEHIVRAEKLLRKENVEKDAKQLERLIAQMRVVAGHLEAGMPYAYTGDDRRVEFKPAFVGDYCKEAVWKHARKWLLMSATIISSSSLLRGLGWDGRYQTVQIGSSFPAKNRTITVRSTADMRRGGGDGELERLTGAVRELVAGEPGRCVVHTVSYSLAAAVCGSLGRAVPGPSGVSKRVFSYRMAGERAAAVAEYLRTPASVLVAPSADRGIDLPDDLCRLTVIAKVPYPNLGDRMVRMRTYMGRDGQIWYTTTTVRTIVQMAGRGVRHKDDWCRTVILDSQFGSGVWSRGRGLFPSWFKEAMVWEPKG